MERLVIFVPKAHCQLLRDFLRREKLLDKGSIQERGTKIGIPLVCADQEKIMSLIKHHFDFDLQEVEICERKSQGEIFLQTFKKKISFRP